VGNWGTLGYNRLMVFELLGWWYGPGWAQAIKRIYKWAHGISLELSAGQLLHSLFEPWHRIVSAGGRSLDVKIKNFVDNLVSRGVGACVRSLVLITAAAAMIAAVIFGVFVAVVWPLIPPLILYSLYRGIIG
jgi:hypothetical protein